MKNIFLVYSNIFGDQKNIKDKVIKNTAIKIR